MIAARRLRMYVHVIAPHPELTCLHETQTNACGFKVARVRRWQDPHVLVAASHQPLISSEDVANWVGN